MPESLHVRVSPKTKLAINGVPDKCASDIIDEWRIAWINAQPTVVDIANEMSDKLGEVLKYHGHDPQIARLIRECIVISINDKDKYKLYADLMFELIKGD